MAKYWTCKKRSNNVVCNHRNPPRVRNCRACGKTRPPKRFPKHRLVLKELSYDDYIKINGGEFCWIHRKLGIPEAARTRRLHRDHDHITGRPRGLLCATCNRAIKMWMTPEWLEMAAQYLRHFS